jgi:hypothetical protein
VVPIQQEQRPADASERYDQQRPKRIRRGPESKHQDRNNDEADRGLRATPRNTSRYGTGIRRRLTANCFGIHRDDGVARRYGLELAMVLGNLVKAIATGLVYEAGYFSDTLVVQARKTILTASPSIRSSGSPSSIV